VRSGVRLARAADAMRFACVAVEYSSQAHSRLHARRVFNGVPCERGVVLGEARQMYVGDVGDAADACCLLVERDRCRRRESVGFETDRWM
jgi:hypothetical protein